MIIFGALPWDAKTPNRLTVSALPTISSNLVGRYFSILRVREREREIGNQNRKFETGIAPLTMAGVVVWMCLRVQQWLRGLVQEHLQP